MRILSVSAPNAEPAIISAPIPSPSETQIQVRVAATALNFADLLLIEGRYQDTPPFPVVPGLEISGTITAIGTKVTGQKVGDRIAAIVGHGGLADYAVFEAGRALGLRDTIDDATAAAFQITYATAHLSLIRRARLAKGESLVVLGQPGAQASRLSRSPKPSGQRSLRSRVAQSALPLRATLALTS